MPEEPANAEDAEESDEYSENFVDRYYWQMQEIDQEFETNRDRYNQSIEEIQKKCVCTGICLCE